MLLWLLIATLASGLLFGLIPALHGSGGPVDESLRAFGRSSTGSVRVRRLRRLLVGSQFAIATPVLVVAGLLLTSLSRLGRVDLGFDGHGVVTGAIRLPESQYPEPARVAGFWDGLEQRVEALPSVTGVAFADGRPPNDVDDYNNFDLEDSPTPAGQSQPVTPWVAVTPPYFRALGLKLLEGRLLDERDALRPDIEAVVVDRAWARRFFPGASAIGKRLHEAGCTSCPWTSVVGIVSEVKYAGLDQPDSGTVYRPLERTSRFRYLVLRTTGDPAVSLSEVRQVVHELDPALPFSSAATVDELVARSLERPRSLSLLVGVFAAIALLLSVIGIYGVMAYYVQQHAKDISIRVALGGHPRAVLRLVLGQAMGVVASGVAVGLLAALASTRLASRLLFGVGTSDGRTFVGVGALMLAASLVACWGPARRAVSMPPAVVLRNE